MSYSQMVKNELSGCRLHCKSCPKALLYGMLLFGRGFETQEAGRTVLFSTENRRAAGLFAETVIELTGAIVTVTEPDLAPRFPRSADRGRQPADRGRRPVYNVTLDDDGDVHTLLSLFFKGAVPDRSGIRPSFVRRECCAMSFVRGAYLACGTMADPQKEYHLEFGTTEDSLCDDLLELLSLYELSFHKSSRGRYSIAYIKESNQIEDFLARTGAVRSSMELMNLKIEKELRNKANRVTNCETANIDKTVNASLEQIRKITLLRDHAGFEQLPPQLLEAAELRLANPDASLRELCELAGGRISRSGFNHRLQKLMELADKLSADPSGQE